MFIEAHYIYLIIDPRTGSVVYVGRTKSPKSRFYSHCNNKSTVIGKFLNIMQKEGFKPIFEIVEECNWNLADKTEKKWISIKVKEGCKLINSCCNKKEKNHPFDLKISNGINYEL